MLHFMYREIIQWVMERTENSDTAKSSYNILQKNK